MATTKPASSFCLALALLALPHCSSSDSGPPGTANSGSSGIHDYCSRTCAKAESCGVEVSGPDPSSCVAGCEAKLEHDPLRLVRTDTVSAIAACAEAVDCTRLQSAADFSETLASCQEDTLKATVPSAAAEGFCDKMSAAETRCGGDPPQHCLDDFKNYGDSTLEAMTACLDKPCNEVTACIEVAAKA